MMTPELPHLFGLSANQVLADCDAHYRGHYCIHHGDHSPRVGIEKLGI